MSPQTPITSRERVLAAIDHRETGRVPLDLGATPSSGISAIAYHNLKQHLGLDGPTRVYDVVQQVAQPEDAILDRFGVDVLDIGRTFNPHPEDWYDFTLPQGITVQFPRWFRPRQPTRDSDTRQCWWHYRALPTTARRNPPRPRVGHS